MKINLTCGAVATIDDDDFDLVHGYTWRTNQHGYPPALDFATVNDWVHGDRMFEELQCACLGMATEIEKLRAAIEAMKQQDPVAWTTFPPAGHYTSISGEAEKWAANGWSVVPLYLTPGAQPAPGVPDGRQLVPILMTNTMLRASRDAWLDDPMRRTTTMWTAALAAAQEVRL